MPEIREEYERLLGYREGAHFIKMDLHTHSPASQCSSFKLPSDLDPRLKALKDGLTNQQGREAARTFLDQLAVGEDVFTETYASPECSSGLEVAERPELGKQKLQRIAEAWIGDLRTLSEDDTKAEKKLLDRGLRDVRAYLASLFWPEEYVMRCHLESLEVVALTDHNHPGYIVPRLPELGTWFGALQAVNEHWRKDLLDDEPAGSRVRPLMVKRIELALARLESDGVTLTDDDAATRKEHPDRPKGLAKEENRLAHTLALLERWSRESIVPRPLTLLPGIEITVSNIHVLAVFPPTWYVPGRIARILGEIGIPENHWGRGFDAAASASVQKTIDLVRKAGGIAIPAHANSDFKGLLRLFKKGLALTKVLEHDALVALESIGGTVLKGESGKKGKDACETLKRLDTKDAKALCFTKGSDSHECRLECDGTGEDLGGRFTWVKMDLRSNDTADEVFRALQLALHCGHNRVVEYPTEDGYNYRGKNNYRIDKTVRDQLVNWQGMRPVILGLTVAGEDSYADELTVRFGPYLNCMIGSGGKSTLLRILGYAFGAIGFMPGSKNSWLPEIVRAYWQEGEESYCVERKGRATEPDDPAVHTRWLRRLEDGAWEVLHESPDEALTALADRVILWPSREVQEKKKSLSSFEGRVIGELLKKLEQAEEAGKRPLLVNQPHEIFNGERLFDSILRRPLLRDRQILWSTGSPNVPAALDADKILVTGEKNGGKCMHVVCGGDLHEDEIRDQLLNHFEGGASAFYRRQALYNL